MCLGIQLTISVLAAYLGAEVQYYSADEYAYIDFETEGGYY